MKPRAKKFRVRRSGPRFDEDQAGVTDPGALTGKPKPPPSFDDDGLGDAPFPGAAVTGEVETAAERSTDDDIAAIRKEGLTGRQLRMARRVAQRHGLAPTSDFDAVRMLRERGIDPFSRTTMLELVVPQGREGEKMPALPKTVRPAQPPATPLFDDEARAREIRRMQRDIARRRRLKLLLLFARLAVFVFLPTAMAGYYYYAMATPMYATKSEFVIQQADPPASSGMGGLLSGTSFATSQDSITVQSYLQSRDAMLRLDDDLGFKSHFSQPEIDPLQRLDADATNEAAYALYRKKVKIGYDPTEGIVKMEVVAADPQTSAAFSRALIGYAEAQVDSLTQRLREDQMKGAREGFDEAEAKMIAAQQRVLELQERLGVLDPVAESSALMSQISTFEVQLREKELELDQLLDNARPNQARVDGVRGDIRRLDALIASLRGQLTESGATNASLARISGELRIAEADLQNRQLMMQQALQQMETARTEANRQVRYLSTGVRPVAPDEATYPRAFENTALAFLIFGGLYLMASLTASILREQVSA